MKNLGTGLGIKFKKHIKIKVIVSISQLRITCIMLILGKLTNHQIKNIRETYGLIS